MTPNQQRITIEKQSAELMAASTLTPSDLELWKSGKASFREVIWLGKRFKVYNALGNIATFEVIDCDADLKDGMAVCIRWLTGERGGESEWIDQTPRLLGATKVFAWVPYMLEVRYLDNARGSDRTLSFSVAFRTAHAPSRLNETDHFIAVL